MIRRTTTGRGAAVAATGSAGPSAASRPSRTWPAQEGQRREERPRGAGRHGPGRELRRAAALSRHRRRAPAAPRPWPESSSSPPPWPLWSSPPSSGAPLWWRRRRGRRSASSSSPRPWPPWSSVGCATAAAPWPARARRRRCRGRSSRRPTGSRTARGLEEALGSTSRSGSTRLGATVHGLAHDLGADLRLGGRVVLRLDGGGVAAAAGGERDGGERAEGDDGDERRRSWLGRASGGPFLGSRPASARARQAAANRGLSLRKTADIAPPRRLDSPAMSVPPKPRVLFVEDESSISGPFSKALAREGFEPRRGRHRGARARARGPDRARHRAARPHAARRRRPRRLPRAAPPQRRPDPDADRARHGDRPHRRPRARRRRLRRQAVQRRRGDRAHPRRAAPQRRARRGGRRARPRPSRSASSRSTPARGARGSAGEELQLTPQGVRPARASWSATPAASSRART